MKRDDGQRLRITHNILACFFDLTLSQAAIAMRICTTTVKKLRKWSGASQWPRNLVLSGKHPEHSRETIRDKRNEMMKWASEFDTVVYDSLARACVPEQLDGLEPLSPHTLDILESLPSDALENIPVEELRDILTPEAKPSSDAADDAADSMEAELEEEKDEDDEFFEEIARRDALIATHGPRAFDMI